MDWLFSTGASVCGSSGDFLRSLVPALGTTGNRIELLPAPTEQRIQSEVSSEESIDGPASGMETPARVGPADHATAQSVRRTSTFYRRRKIGLKQVLKKRSVESPSKGDCAVRKARIKLPAHSPFASPPVWVRSPFPVSQVEGVELGPSSSSSSSPPPPLQHHTPEGHEEEFVAAQSVQALFRGFSVRRARLLPQLRLARHAREAAGAALVFRREDASVTLQASFRGFSVRVAAKRAREAALQLERLARAAALQREQQLFADNARRPGPGFVLRVLSERGEQGHINVCGHFAVSDALSTQGVSGCPYAVLLPPDLWPESGSLRAVTVVVHPKYIFLAADDPGCAKLELSLRLLLLLNTTVLAGTGASKSDSTNQVESASVKEDYRFVDCDDNFFGSLPPPLFMLPADMPPLEEFADLLVEPRPGVVLCARRHGDGAPVYVNLVHHADVPRFPLDNPYVLLTNERSLLMPGQNEQEHESAESDPDTTDTTAVCGFVFDAAVATATWRVACETESVLVQESKGFLVDKDYRLRRVASGYLGRDSVPLPLRLPAAEVGKSAIVDGAFETDWRRIGVPGLEFLSCMRPATDEDEDNSALEGAASVVSGKVCARVRSAPRCGGREESRWRYFQFPTPGIVVQTKSVANGRVVYVNVCGHHGVSDHVDGDCPFVVTMAARDVATVAAVPALALTVVVHIKHVLHARAEASLREKLAVALLKKLNAGSLAASAVDLHCSFPQLPHDFCGGCPEPFVFPADMPVTAAFEDVSFVPARGLCLRASAVVGARRQQELLRGLCLDHPPEEVLLDDHRCEVELYVNIVWHADVPLLPPRDKRAGKADKPYFLLGNLRRLYSFLVVDAAVHDSVWIAVAGDPKAKTAVCQAALVAAKTFLHDYEDRGGGDYEVLVTPTYQGPRVLQLQLSGLERALTAPLDADRRRHEAAERAAEEARVVVDQKRAFRRTTLAAARAGRAAGSKHADLVSSLVRLTAHRVSMVGELGSGCSSSAEGDEERVRLQQAHRDFVAAQKTAVVHARSATKLQSSFRGYARRRDMGAADARVAGPILQLQQAYLANVATPFKDARLRDRQRRVDTAVRLTVRGALDGLVSRLTAQELCEAITAGVDAAVAVGSLDMEAHAARTAESFRLARLHCVCGRTEAQRLRAQAEEFALSESARLEQERVRTAERGRLDRNATRLQSSFRGYAHRRNMKTSDAKMVESVLEQQASYVQIVAAPFRVRLETDLVRVGASRYDSREAGAKAKATSSALSQASWQLCDVAAHGIEISQDAAAEVQIDQLELDDVDGAVARSRLASQAARRELRRLTLQADEYARALMEEEALLRAELEAQAEDLAADAEVEQAVLAAQRRMYEEAAILREYLHTRLFGGSGDRSDRARRGGKRLPFSFKDGAAAARRADLVVVVGGAAMAEQAVPMGALRVQQTDIARAVRRGRQQQIAAAAEHARLAAAAKDFAWEESIRVVRQKKEAAAFVLRHEGATRLQSSFRGYAHRKRMKSADSGIEGSILTEQSAYAMSTGAPFRQTLRDRLDEVSNSRCAAVLSSSTAADTKAALTASEESWQESVYACKDFADRVRQRDIGREMQRFRSAAKQARQSSALARTEQERLVTAAAKAAERVRQRKARLDAGQMLDDGVSAAVLQQQAAWVASVAPHKQRVRTTLRTLVGLVEHIRLASSADAAPLLSPVGGALAVSQSSVGECMHPEDLGPAAAAVRRGCNSSGRAESERDRLRAAAAEFLVADQKRRAREHREAALFAVQSGAATRLQSSYRGYARRREMQMADALVVEQVTRPQAERAAAVHVPFRAMMFGRLNDLCRVSGSVAESVTEIKSTTFLLAEATELVGGMVLSARYACDDAQMATAALDGALVALYDSIDAARRCGAEGAREALRLQKQAGEFVAAEETRVERVRQLRHETEYRDYSATRVQSRFRGYIRRRDNHAADSAVEASVLEAQQANRKALVATPFYKSMATFVMPLKASASVRRGPRESTIAVQSGRGLRLLLSELAPSLRDTVSTAKFVASSVRLSNAARAVSAATAARAGAVQSSSGGMAEHRRLAQASTAFVASEHRRLARELAEARDFTRRAAAAAAIQSRFRGRAHRHRMRAADAAVATAILAAQASFVSGVAASFRAVRTAGVNAGRTRVHAARDASSTAVGVRHRLTSSAQNLFATTASCRSTADSSRWERAGLARTVAAVGATIDRSLLRNARAESELLRLRAEASEFRESEDIRLENERRRAEECAQREAAATRLQTAYRGHAVRRDLLAADAATASQILAEQNDYMVNVKSFELLLFGDFNAACAKQSSVADSAAAAVRTSSEIARDSAYLREVIAAAKSAHSQTTVVLERTIQVVELAVQASGGSASAAASRAAAEQERLLHARNCFVVGELQRVLREQIITAEAAERDQAAVRLQSRFRGYTLRRDMAAADAVVVDTVMGLQTQYQTGVAAPFRAALRRKLTAIPTVCISEAHRDWDEWSKVHHASAAASASSSGSVQLEPIRAALEPVGARVYQSWLHCTSATLEQGRLQEQIRVQLAAERRRVELLRQAAAAFSKRERAAARVQSRFRGYIRRRDNHAADSAVEASVLEAQTAFGATIAAPFQAPLRERLSAIPHVLAVAAEAAQESADVSAGLDEHACALCFVTLAAKQTAEGTAGEAESSLHAHVTKAFLRSRHWSATGRAEEARLRRRAEFAAAEEVWRVERGRQLARETVARDQAAVRLQSRFRGYSLRRDMAAADAAVVDTVMGLQTQYQTGVAAPFRAALRRKLAAVGTNPLRSVVTSVSRRGGAARTRLSHVVQSAQAAQCPMEVVRRVGQMSHLDNSVDHARLCSAAAEAKASRLLSAHMAFLAEEAKRRSGPRAAWDAPRTPAKVPQIPVRGADGHASSPSGAGVTAGFGAGQRSYGRDMAVAPTGLERYLVFEHSPGREREKVHAHLQQPRPQPLQPPPLTVDTSPRSPAQRRVRTAGSSASVTGRSGPDLVGKPLTGSATPGSDRDIKTAPPSWSHAVATASSGSGNSNSNSSGSGRSSMANSPQRGWESRRRPASESSSRPSTGTGAQSALNRRLVMDDIQ